MNGPDHYREAERVMGLAHDSQNQGSWENANIQIQRAQVHATLALAAATIDAPFRGASMGQEFGNWQPVLAPDPQASIYDRDCGIEWGWGGNRETLQGYADEHNEQQVPEHSRATARSTPDTEQGE